MALEENILTMNVTNAVSIIVMFLIDAVIILGLVWAVMFLLGKTGIKKDTENASTN